MQRHIIVGADSGKTSAIACLDLDGKLICLKTRRFAGTGWFVENIRSAGRPVIIAGDKKKPGSMLCELSTIFDAVLFLPGSDLSVEKKKQIAQGFENFHERDALAAAITAFNTYAGKLRQADRLAKQSGANADDIKAMVIRKYSVHEAISGKIAGRRLVRTAQA